MACQELSQDPYVGFDLGRDVLPAFYATHYPSVAFAGIQLQIALDNTSSAAAFRGVQQSNYKIQIANIIGQYMRDLAQVGANLYPQDFDCSAEVPGHILSLGM